MKNYKFKAGMSCPVTAEDTHNEFIRIRKQEGILTAENLLQASSHPNATLYPYYEWDDKREGQKFRIDQSRNLINGVIVVTINEEDGSRTDRNEWIGCRISDEDSESRKLHGNTRNYIKREEVIQSVELKKQHLETLKSQMKGTTERYAAFSDCEEIKQIRELIDSL